MRGDRIMDLEYSLWVWLLPAILGILAVLLGASVL
jgi:hypothetical protein